MDALRHQLFYTKTIPYISKKSINDSLCENVLIRMGEQFYSKVYKIVNETLDDKPFVVKGGAAVAAHLSRFDAPLGDLDLQVCVERDVTIDNVFDELPLRKILNKLQDSIGREYAHCVENILSEIEIFNVLDNDKRRHRHHYWRQQKLIVFKSYENEAVEFSAASRILFKLNPHMPIKITTSTLDDDNNDILVRYSFNVHATSDITMWLHREHDSGKPITFFPFDLYFLDIRVKSHSCDNYGDLVYRNMFDAKVLVDTLQRVIVEQLECIMFNVFNFAWNKVNARYKRLKCLVQMLLSSASNKGVDKTQLDFYYRYLKGQQHTYTVKNVKEIMYCVGPILGARLVIKLYFMKRFVFAIEHVTHQINFPYRHWDQNYFSKCWKQYCCILNDLFDLQYTIYD
ncbi:ac18 [Artaxa digramma nucleopolyhedrovirus]|uniref:Ac18 n=1 Tax=Artaxa digramma nucleopolyhedrovirus TaxID=3070910 RepID=A0AAE6R663_9ABAC|nr:ac18 [Euproctis digramma nucleopolyhedrovirus]QHB21777.1 ac18 [Artaxa digramma nucleopolyhedrovirus]